MDGPGSGRRKGGGNSKRMKNAKGYLKASIKNTKESNHAKVVKVARANVRYMKKAGL